MNVYPYTYPLILSDDIFVAYGGHTGTTTPAMRTASYLIAEQQTSSYIGTLLLPTIITGSVDFFYAPTGYIETDYGYVSKLLWIRVTDPQENALYGLTGTTSFGAIREDTFGHLYIENACRYWGCVATNLNQQFKFQYAYEAGLPTGMASQPAMLMAMTNAAQLVLNEMLLVPANESTGDVGVTEFTSLQYSEKRKKWKNTAFGASPKAAWVAHMIDSTIKKARKAIMFGRL